MILPCSSFNSFILSIFLYQIAIFSSYSRRRLIAFFALTLPCSSFSLSSSRSFSRLAIVVVVVSTNKSQSI